MGCEYNTSLVNSNLPIDPNAASIHRWAFFICAKEARYLSLPPRIDICRERDGHAGESAREAHPARRGEHTVGGVSPRHHAAQTDGAESLHGPVGAEGGASLEPAALPRAALALFGAATVANPSRRTTAIKASLSLIALKSVSRLSTQRGSLRAPEILRDFRGRTDLRKCFLHQCTHWFRKRHSHRTGRWE